MMIAMSIAALAIAPATLSTGACRSDCAVGVHNSGNSVYSINFVVTKDSVNSGNFTNVNGSTGSGIISISSNNADGPQRITVLRKRR